jgi:hypothetical protein
MLCTCSGSSMRSDTTPQQGNPVAVTYIRFCPCSAWRHYTGPSGQRAMRSNRIKSVQHPAGLAFCVYKRFLLTPKREWHLNNVQNFRVLTSQRTQLVSTMEAILLMLYREVLFVVKSAMKCLTTKCIFRRVRKIASSYLCVSPSAWNSSGCH